MAEEKIGVVTHYFGKIAVVAVDITAGELRLGDTIRIKGTGTDFTHQVESMQIEHQPVETAKTGESVGMKVSQPARKNDEVFKVLDD